MKSWRHSGFCGLLVLAAALASPGRSARADDAAGACDQVVVSGDADYQPLTDWRATAEYRQLTAKNLLLRFYLETSGAPQELKRFATAEA